MFLSWTYNEDMNLSNANLKWGLIGLVVVLAGVLTATYYFTNPIAPGPVTLTPQSSSSTQPKITWSEKQIEMVLSPGESATKTLTFTSTQNLPNVVIEAVPKIAPFLSIQPPTIANVPANQPQSVQISFAIPATAVLGDYDGTIHLQDQKQTYPQTSKILIKLWQRFSDSNQHFAFRYPPGWEIHSFSEGRVSLMSPSRASVLNNTSEGDTPPEITVLVLQNENHTAVAEFANSYSDGWFTTYASAAPTIVNGRSAFRFSDLGAGLGHAPLQAVFLNGGPSILLITLNDPESDLTTAQLMIFEQILSTLSF